MTPPEVRTTYRHRRERVLDAMQRAGGGVAIVFTAPMALRNRDAEYPYRHDSSFYWLTGFKEPDAVVALIAGAGQRSSVLFCRERNPARELWEGIRLGPEAAVDTLDFDHAFPIEQIDEQMPLLLADAAAVFHPMSSGPQSAAAHQSLSRWLDAVRRQLRSGVTAPAAMFDLSAIVDEMRLHKDPHEIHTMRRAAQISAAAHARCMRMCRPGMREYHLEAELLHEFRHQGAQAPAYLSIVAAGANACVLHYQAADAVLNDGALCLIDAGCELDSYASDITRTFPVNGRFTGEQRAIYELVLAAQQAALDQTRPGASFDAPHQAATRTLAQGAIDLQLLNGTVDGVIERGELRQFYMHRTGHWLGLDVHDVGDPRVPGSRRSSAALDDRPWRTLAEGMVVTVEPGFYVRPADKVPARFHDIGVRIEDDVLVTATGHDILSIDAPKKVADIEAVMRHGRS